MRVFASNWTLGLWIAISGIGASSAQAGTRAETTAGVGTVTKVVTDLTVYIDELDRAATALERAGTAEATELAKTLRHDCTPVERSLLSDADRFHLSITLPSPAFTDGEMTGRGAGELLQFHCGGLRTLDASNLAVVFRIERDADGALVAYDSHWIRTSRDLDGTAPGALVRRAETSVVRRIGIVAVSIVAGAVLAKETARWIYPGQNDKQKHAIAGELAGFLGTAVGLEIFRGRTVPSALLGILTATAAGVLKEFYDSKTGGDVDRRDVWATMAGGGVGTLAAFSFKIEI